MIQGGGAGMRELSRRHAEVGPLPLVALGMAERMVRAKSFEPALPLFEKALAGDLQGLRSRGRVALSAAEAALSARAFTLAARLLDAAAAERETQLIAQRKQLELAASIGDPGVARQALEELLRQSTGLDRARVLLQLGRLLAAANPEEAARLFAEAAPLAGADRTLPTQIAEEVARLEAQRQLPEALAPQVEPTRRRQPVAPEASARRRERSRARTSASPAAPELPLRPQSPASVEPAPLPLADGSREPAGEPPRAARGTASRAAPPDPRCSRRAARLRPRPPRAAAPRATESEPPPAYAVDETDEQRLLRELGQGSFEAGEQLVALYGARGAERSPDVLAVRRQQAALRLGDADRAAEARRGRLARRELGVCARHRARDPRARPRPPGARAAALGAAPRPGSRRRAPLPLHRRLGRPRGARAGAGHRALPSGRGAVPAHGGGAGAARRGDGARRGLRHRGAVPRAGAHRALPPARRRGARYPDGAPPAPPSFKIALLSPPAIVLNGEVREETPELRYLLGAALTGAMPEHALVNAVGEEGLRTLIDALPAAFGPVAEPAPGQRSGRSPGAEPVAAGRPARRPPPARAVRRPGPDHPRRRRERHPPGHAPGRALRVRQPRHDALADRARALLAARHLPRLARGPRHRGDRAPGGRRPPQARRPDRVRRGEVGARHYPASAAAPTGAPQPALGRQVAAAKSLLRGSRLASRSSSRHLPGGIMNLLLASIGALARARWQRDVRGATPLSGLAAPTTQRTRRSAPRPPWHGRRLRSSRSSPCRHVHERLPHHRPAAVHGADSTPRPFLLESTAAPDPRTVVIVDTPAARRDRDLQRRGHLAGRSRPGSTGQFSVRPVAPLHRLRLHRPRRALPLPAPGHDRRSGHARPDDRAARVGEWQPGEHPGRRTAAIPRR